MKSLALKRLLAIVALISMPCFISAQESDSIAERAKQLAKIADANRHDWQAQYETGLCYLDSMFSESGFMQAETYLRRALDIAQAQDVKRDTILGKTLLTMSNLYARKHNSKEMLEYHKKGVQAYVDELGPSEASIPSRIASLASNILVLYCLEGTDSGADLTDAIRLLRTALQLYYQLPEEQQTCGRDDLETALALASELFLTEQQYLIKDKAWLWTDINDGRKYILLAFDNYTLEYPYGLLATLLIRAQNDDPASERKRGMILMDEQGNVSEREHGQIDFNYNYTLDGNNFMLNADNTIHLIHITPQRRKELIDALHTFETNK